MRLLGRDEDQDRRANHVPVNRSLNSGAIRLHKVPKHHRFNSRNLSPSKLSLYTMTLATFYSMSSYLDLTALSLGMRERSVRRDMYLVRISS
jgi:hypothetical protein